MLRHSFIDGFLQAALLSILPPRIPFRRNVNPSSIPLFRFLGAILILRPQLPRNPRTCRVASIVQILLHAAPMGSLLSRNASSPILSVPPRTRTKVCLRLVPRLVFQKVSQVLIAFQRWSPCEIRGFRIEAFHIPWSLVVHRRNFSIVPTVAISMLSLQPVLLARSSRQCLVKCCIPISPGCCC